MKRLVFALLLPAGHLCHADGLTHEQSDALAAEAAQLAPSSDTPQPQAPTPAQYSTLGTWSAVIPWTPHIPVTCAQLPDGRLLTFASSQRNNFPPGSFTYAATWDYRTGEFVEINNTRHDMFCGGVSLLPDGRLLVNGGNNTIRDSSVFDWRTSTWSAAADMQDPRWYNTSVALPDGSVFTASGSGGSDTAERWQEGKGWTRYTNINWALATDEGGTESIWHPFLHVAPDGRIAHTGPTHTMHWVDTTGNGQFISTSAVVPGSYYPKDGAMVMFNEGKILQAGGRTMGTGEPSKLACVIDINGSTPRVTPTGSLAFARTFANGVVLPTGEVMAIGGNTSQVKFSDDGSVLTPEIWNPATGQWRRGADMWVPRNYHSLAILLPDGRVWSGGGGLSGNAADHQDAQIYTPAVLYKADGTPAERPEIGETPEVIGPGMAFAVRATAGMKRFTFIKMASLTHCVTSDLRFLELPFTEHEPGVYVLKAPANVNVLTPGYWMLFAISPEGPYSVSTTVLVDATLTDSISQPGDQLSTVGRNAVPAGIKSFGYSPASRVFSASGLPPGLVLDAASGVISGTPSVIGRYSVTVTVNDGLLEPASVTFQWTVHSDLVLAPLTHAPAPTGSVIDLTVSASGSASPEFQWDFGDGSPLSGFSSSTTISHTYAAPGRYLVTLTARDDTGAVVTTSFHQAVHAPLTSARPAVSSSIVYQARSGANARLWVVNPDQDSVTVFDAVTRTRNAIIGTGRAPRSVAIAPDGRAWVVNSESGSLSIIGTNLSVVQTVPLPRGSRPFAVVFDPAGTAAYVSLQDSGLVLKINPARPAQFLGSASAGASVRHLSVSADGAKVYATRFITPHLPGEETANVVTQDGDTQYGGEVRVIDAASMAVTKTIILSHSEEEDSSIAGRGIPNYLGPAVLSPDGTNAWVPSKKDNIKRGQLRDGRPLTHDNAVRSITSRIDLSTESEDHAARIDFNDAGIASTAAYDPAGMYLFTALEGSREVAVVDAWNQRELLRFTAGRAPQGVATSPDGRFVYVHNFMDRSVTIHDVSAILGGAETAPPTTALLSCINTEKLPATVLKGKQFFYDSRDPRMALQQYLSCASCHNDGDQDGRVWDFTSFGEGLRNNISLRGHATHGPPHWSGNFDEIQDFEGQIRSFAGGQGLMSDGDFHTGTRDQPLGTPKAGVSADLDALAAYVTSLTTTGTSPNRSSTGALTADAVAGQQIFRAQNCAACHDGARFTNSALNVFANIGTIKPSSGQRLGAPLTGLDVPTLRGLWSTAPYLHDGSAATLEAAVRAHQGVSLTDSEMSKVVSFLSQIDDAVVRAPSPLSIVLATASSSVNASFPVAGFLSEAAGGFTASDITVTGGTLRGFSISGTSFSFYVEPTAASVSIRIAANVMSDSTGLGNLASNVLTLTNTRDVTAPVLTLSTPADTVSGAFEVSITASESVSGLSVSDFIVTNGSAANLTGGGAGYSVTITPASSGVVTVQLPAEAATDAAENGSAASNTLSVTFAPVNNTPPTVTLGTAAAEVSGVFDVSVSFNESVAGVSVNDFIITNGSATALSGGGSSYALSVTPAAEGAVTVQYSKDVVSDILSVHYTVPADPAPTVVLAACGGGFTVSAQFSEAVTDVSEGDFIVTNGHVTGLSGSDSLWIVTIQPATAGDVSVRLPADAAQDSAAQGSSASNTVILTYDPPAPLMAKINFQSTATPTPNGWSADNGEVFAERNGLTYGWNKDHTAQGRDRNAMTDQRQDSFIRMQAGARWEIAVANGEYDVTLSVGDATAASTNTLNVEGASAWSAAACAAGAFEMKTRRVLVSDGRLTLDNGGAAGGATALDYVEISSASSIPSATPNGLAADYFAGAGFDQLRFSRIDRGIDFRWSAAAPDARLPSDNFSVRWQGAVIPRHSERYSFAATSDNGLRLWVNGQLLIDNWSRHDEETDSGEIDLQAGVPVAIRMEFFANDGDAVVRLLWASTSQPLEVIPASRLQASAPGETVTPYPSSFAAWISSGRSNGPDTSATSNADGDDLPDLLEYALGGSAGSGISAGDALRLDTRGRHVNASVIRPQGLGDLNWLLETSADLKTWTPLNLTAAVSDNADGTETLRWANLDAAAGQSPALGMVRLKVQHTPTGATAATAPYAWQQWTPQNGMQSVGVNVVNTPVFSGYAHSATDTVLYLTDASYLPGVVDADACYYVEITDGTYAGHHWDLAHIGDRALLIDTESANNTLAALPADIGGARMAVRKHITLGQVFDKTLLRGASSPASADQVQVLSENGFKTYWLLRAGSYHQWIAAGDATLTSADGMVIPPGTGVMLKSAGSSASVLLITGQVRTTPFAHLISSGFSLLANPWPLPASATGLNMTSASSFTATTGPASADALQLWKGDSLAGASGYDGYWFFQSPRSATAAAWVSSRDATLRSQNGLPLFKAGRAAYFTRHGSSSSVWVVPGL
ncbi:Ig-like domain-containing protein [Prosthecobacter sp.]|uniref:Ig-like domain-containing protein n=1 Tax=Prosthecobacter sp. TaxID=1965333 RepID=UPI003782F202